jgi:hypothetical protein
MFDPFQDAAPTTSTAAQTQEDKPVTIAVTPQSDGKVVVTLKGGTGYDSPWIVIHAADVDDALAQLKDDALGELIQRTAQVGKYFAESGKPAGQAAPQQQQAPQGRPGQPQGSQQAPNGEERYCAHGKRQFKSGVNKSGKPYKAFFCSSQDRNNQCAPEWA